MCSHVLRVVSVEHCAENNASTKHGKYAEFFLELLNGLQESYVLDDAH